MNRAGFRAIRIGRLSALVRPRALACLTLLALLTGSAVLGALLVLLADNVGRLAFLPLQLPAGIVISLIGGPFFLLLLWQRRDRF